MSGAALPPLGATIVDGGVHFLVWSPGSDRVDVVVEGAGVHPLEGDGEGYFSARVDGLGPGARYRYRLDGADDYPDPASRSQPEGVHGPSEVVDPGAFEWSDAGWEGVDLADLVVYELHVGTFTDEGSFDAAAERLEDLAGLGITAVEVMPVADFPGSRNWGYDGVNLFAPAASYGGAEAFRRFVDRAHGLGLAVLLDAVYNHLGPEGNYLPAVTRGAFFTDRHKTPWGDAVNFDGPDAAGVRTLVVANALHWLTEYHIDGLRLDATHAIVDESDRHILAELSERVRDLPGWGRILIAEDERNQPGVVAPPADGGLGMDAVWADDIHHQLRSFAAGDNDGYYAHYTGSISDIVTTLRHGWWRDMEAALDLSPPRFVHCIQNHDQVGNRAFGERLNHEVDPALYRALSALLLLSPYTPLLFMGQEWSASSPFLFFTDHPEPLGQQVTRGRREEFGRFAAFADPETRRQIPDPQDPATRQSSVLRWEEREESQHAGVLALYTELLRLRRGHPALGQATRDSFAVAALGEGALMMKRAGAGGEEITAIFNLRGELRTEVEVAGGASSCRILLATEDRRFGGDGGWGRAEADGRVHLVRPCALLIETAKSSA